jgi:hypothetical protein
VKRPVHVSVVIGAVLASLAGCRQLGAVGRAGGREHDHSRRSLASDERDSVSRERASDDDRETRYRELMREREQARSHQRALDRQFASELYRSAVDDWL